MKTPMVTGKADIGIARNCHAGAKMCSKNMEVP